MLNSRQFPNSWDDLSEFIRPSRHNQLFRQARTNNNNLHNIIVGVHWILPKISFTTLGQKEFFLLIENMYFEITLFSKLLWTVVLSTSTILWKNSMVKAELWDDLRSYGSLIRLWVQKLNYKHNNQLVSPKTVNT